MPIRIFKGLLDGLLSRSGLRPSQKGQLYRCRYETRIKNLSEERKEFFLIVPTPSNQHQQKLISNPEFRPAQPRLGMEEKFSNSYALWTSSIEADQALTFSQFFDCRVEPMKVSIDQNFSFQDYSNSDVDVLKYLRPERKIKKETLELATELRGGEEKLEPLLKALNTYLRDQESLEGASLPDSNHFFIELCHALTIPARLVSGFWAGGKGRDSQENEKKTWVEIALPNGHWVPADPALERLRRQKKTDKEGGLGMIGSDRIVFSYGEDLVIKLGPRQKLNLGVLQEPIIFPQFDPHEILLERNFYTKRLKRVRS